MKRYFNFRFIVITILTFTFTSAVDAYADGMGFEEREIISGYSNDLPNPKIKREIFVAAEKSQYCAIDFDNGIQKMVLNIDLSTALTGKAFYWLFPVPGDPHKVKIAHIDKFPLFQGTNIEEMFQYRLG